VSGKEWRVPPPGNWHPITTEEYLRRLVADGATDEEIWERLKDGIWISERRHLEAVLYELREGWAEIAAAYAKCEHRPTQVAVATKLGISETALRDRLRRFGVRDWREVHARMVQKT
jgi:hypothetical protein